MTNQERGYPVLTISAASIAAETYILSASLTAPGQPSSSSCMYKGTVWMVAV